MQEEEKQGHELGESRSYGSSFYAEGRKTEFSENESPVEEYVGENHHNAIQGKGGSPCRTYIE